jgi:hypothetical protein
MCFVTSLGTDVIITYEKHIISLGVLEAGFGKEQKIWGALSIKKNTGIFQSLFI